MTSLVNLKTICDSDNFQVEYEIIPPFDVSIETDSGQLANIKARKQIENRLQINSEKIEELNKEIKRLTNHADGIDYMVAVGSGIIAGVVDSLWVGEFSFSRGKAWSDKKVNDFVMKTAKKQGYTGKRLDGAIKHLEDKFKIPGDNIWKGKNKGISAKSHHIDDLAHHPSVIGLFFSILTQFTKKGYFSNNEGIFLPISIDPNGDGLIGHDITSKIFCGTVNWFYHLVSDMAGSSKTAGGGMGIPGPILSLMKELSAIPGIKKSGLPQKINDAFVKNNFDLRSELAVGHELGRQAVPVILNEVMVRSFYFIRRLVKEVKEKRNFKDIEWKNCLPWNNRTIVRMLTIATGTFTAFDMIDAAIRSGLKSGGNPALFAKEFILRVNFVGLGRFAIAVYSDVKMGIKRAKLRNQRIAIYSEQLHLANARIFYLQADTWTAAQKTEQTINEALEIMDKTMVYYAKSLQVIEADIEDIEHSKKKIERKNPALINEIEEALKWG